MGRPSFSRVRSVAALVAVALLTLVLAAPAGAAATPTLVKDINPFGSSNPTSLTTIGSTIYFAANDGVHGNELWKSDGTAVGTKMVKNIRPYGKGSFPMNLTTVNGTLFFTANDGKHGRELWKSDGTKAGTVMVKDVGSLYMRVPPIAVGARLFFFRDMGFDTFQLYVTDGTSTGTKGDLTDDSMTMASSRASARATLNGKLYFIPYGHDASAQLWVSNGTRSGTHRVAGSPKADEIYFLPAHGQNLYFVTFSQVAEVSIQLWKTDGTKLGTKPLTSVGELGTVPDEAVKMGKQLYFGESGMLGALWKTDGTATGTREISGSAVAFLIATGGRLYFSAHGALLTSDGTAAGTHELMQSEGGWLRHLVPVGNQVCFFAPNEDFGTWTLGKSDGTTGGTYAVKSFVNSAATDTPGASMGGRFFFAADDGSHGAELWSYTP